MIVRSQLNSGAMYGWFSLCAEHHLQVCYFWSDRRGGCAYLWMCLTNQGSFAPSLVRRNVIPQWALTPRRDCRRACHFWELHKDNITTSIASFQFPSRSSEHYPVVSARVHLSGFIAFGGGTFVRVAVWKSGFLGSVAAPIRRPHPLAVTDTQNNEVAKDLVGSQLTTERNPKRLRRTPDGPSRLA